MKKLSVIILNWNGKEVMNTFLPSVVANTHGDEVELIVADNGSGDGSVEWLRTNYPSLRIIELRRNYGFAEGYNRAVEMVETPYVLLLNSDVEVEKGWWQPLLEFMEVTPDAGAVMPKVLSYMDRDTFEHAGAAGGLMDNLGYPYCRGRVLGRVEKDLGQYDGAPQEVAWATGAAMLVRRDVYLKAGGLDKDFFAHMEEIDLCIRMRRMGYKSYIVTDSRVFHLGGGSLPYGNPRKTYLNFRNNLLLLHKNLPEGEGRRKLFIRRLADTLAFGMYLLTGKWKDARAVVKAHGDFKRMRGNYRDFPAENIFPQLPGTDKSIFKLMIKK